MDIPKHLDTPEFKATWEDWLEYRNGEKGVKLGPIAIKRQLKFLGKHTETEAIKIIDQSINSNWTGLFEVKTFNNKWQPKQSKESSWCRS